MTEHWAQFWLDVANAYWDNHYEQLQTKYNFTHFWRDVHRAATSRRWRRPEKEGRVCQVPDCDKPLPKGRRRWCSKEHMTLGYFELSTIRGFVFYRDKGVCASCGIVSENWDADHIIPVVEGGPTTPENLRTLCKPCHKRETRYLAQRRAAKVRPQVAIDFERATA